MKNYEVKLNFKDLLILQENLDDISLKEEISTLINNYGDKLRQKSFEFNESDIDKIHNCLTDLLCQKGLEENDEPNAFGYYVEDLIDKFYIE